MTSKIYKGKPNVKASNVINAIRQIGDFAEKTIDGQYGRTAVIESDNIKILSSELDFEFEIEFDDDTEADVAEITIFNLSNSTINHFQNGGRITITAGYGNDTGIIYSGKITQKKTTYEGVDKVTRIRALDDISRENRTVESITYAENTSASYILRDLCGRVGLPIAYFKVYRDYTYTKEVTVNGSLSDAIADYADVCGVSAYVCKGKLYVRSLRDGDNTRFKLSADTGLLSVSEFEKTMKTEEFGEEVIKGFDVEMLLQHRLQTASIIELDSINYKGRFRVKSGKHIMDNDDFITKVRLIPA